MRNGRNLLVGLVSCVVGLVGLMSAGRAAAANPIHACKAALRSTQSHLNACSNDLADCQTDLAACEAVPDVVFPGDGVTGPALSYTDNGDGTITDNNTQLIWEKKDSAAGVHDVGNTYQWSSSGTAADGSLFTTFLATLNDKCDGDETTACTSNAECTGIGNGLCGLAGHRDWRIPNVKELQSIVDYSKPLPGPTIASTFPGPTVASLYWSSTSYAYIPIDTWFVNFNDGHVLLVDNESPNVSARAVRGGS